MAANQTSYPFSSNEVSEVDQDLKKLLREIKAMAEETGINFAEEWQYGDVCFTVEEKTVYASKMILSMWSPVFKAMFSHNFKESNASTIDLPEKSFDDVIELMHVLHPPNKDISDENVLQLLPLLQEYQIDKIAEKCEEHLMGEANCVKNFILAQKFNLKKLYQANLAYLHRAPISRLRKQEDFDKLEQELLIEILTEKCEKFESSMDTLREVRMVLERKKPTTFPGMHLLCEGCTTAREQQVECVECMKGCCKKITEVLRNMER